MREKLSMIEQWKRARKASVPIIGIETQDQAASRVKIVQVSNGSAAVVEWNILQGVKPLNNEAVNKLSKICGSSDPETLNNPSEMLLAVIKAPERTVVIMSNAQRYFVGENAASVVQGIANIRDEFKATGATLVLMGPTIIVPPEIAQDVMVIDDPLPAIDEIREIIVGVCEAAEMQVPSDIDRLADMLIGLSAFSVEQTVATCVWKSGEGVVDIDRVQLRAKKNKAIEQTKGLTIYSPDGSALWENLYDLDNLKFDLECIANNFNGILFVDEIEKVFSGSGTDTSGVSGDFLAQWLKFMEDNPGVMGIILAGHPGCGKSASSKALAEHAEYDCFIFDQGAMKESLVGQSGANIRAAFKTVGTATNYKLLVLATCNKLESLPPEFKSRFTLGTYFVGLPGREGKDAMWEHYAKVYSVSNERTFDDDGWTGREIKACCQRASMMGKSIDVAARYVVPVTKSDPESIEKLEMIASGKFIDASQDGVYQKRMDVKGAARKFNLN